MFFNKKIIRHYSSILFDYSSKQIGNDFYKETKKIYVLISKDHIFYNILCTRLLTPKKKKKN
ncbi:hypothetical protein [Blattabacterium cuenoti]|uniref:hypothetical protein n=1 Tax=Blattabacterium cuenoti TaxID=1653831 RepID=UPI00163CBDF2|nr:hypothetical protein [Blattabacterium cuenoti]